MSNICLLFAIFLVFFTLIFNISKGSSSYFKETKRGYLLDRYGEPLVINKENFQAYLLMKGKSLFGKDVPDEVKPYIQETLELPKKGLLLISEGLTQDEVYKLQNVKNVIIKGEIRRKVLYPEMRALIGSTLGGEGLSGLEKAFNKELKGIDSKSTSLDLNLCKRIYNYARKWGPNFPTDVAIFKRETGELLAFYSIDEKVFLMEPLVIRENILNKVPKETLWELGKAEYKKEGNFLRLTPLHIVQSFLEEDCGKIINPTLTPLKEKLCDRLTLERENLYLYLSHNKRWLSFITKDDYLLVLSGYLPSEEKDEEPFWQRLKKEHDHLVNLMIKP
ncbi:MAG: hypothetical protein RMI93_06325 [Caldimicrobium sp.]|nr:hypothetical protein [Caldimicrobium sp.]MDW8183203.1 hypothetical protein [Caldimicrobium sp.]